jgi:molybdopterin/thiamine biosynthesis adenylyltransferase
VAIIIGLIFFNTIFHEIGHGVVCTYFGIPVRSVGIMVFYLQPAAYVDITDSWRLKSKWHRVAISCAGIYVQLILTFLACCGWLYLRSMHRQSALLTIFIGLNLSSVFFNLLPFVRLDGYWILSNIVGIPNLLDRAQEWYRVSVLSLVRRRPVESKNLRYNAVLAMTPLGRGLLACFGATATVFGLSMWLGGIAFLFRVARWLGISTGFRFLAVFGVLLSIGAWFGIRVFLARRRAAKGAETPAVAPAIPVPQPPFVTQVIDATRPIRLNPFTTTVTNADGTVIFAWSAPDQLVIPNGRRLLDVLAELRKGSVTIEQLQQSGRYDAGVGDTIQRLWGLRHLRYTSDWEPIEGNARYSRQLGWLSMNAGVRGSEAAILDRLKAKTITILGVGGVGTHVAWNLAACGIGELHLVDGDTVEMSNLNRQLFYTPQDVGRPKVEVTAERLKQFNPDLKVRTTKMYLNGVSDIAKAIHRSDYVVRSLDSPAEIMTWVNEACLKAGIPSLGGGFFAQGAIVGPTVIPGETACLACNASSALPTVDRGTGGTFAPVVTTCAGLISGEVVAYLGKLGKVRTAGAIMLIEAPTFSINFSSIQKNENCRACGQAQARAVTA